MVNKQSKNGPPDLKDIKSEEQFIAQLIENRKRQMDALIKIISSIDEMPQPVKTPVKADPLSRLKSKFFKTKINL